MRFLKKSAAGIALMLVLAVSTATGQTNSAGCVPPLPGISETPPCASTQMSSDEPETAGQMETPRPNEESEFSFTDLALDVISVLLLF